jgi:heavy metal translocating P-type ATPase
MALPSLPIAREGQAVRRIIEARDVLLFAATAMLLVAGTVAWALGMHPAASALWFVATGLGLAYSTITTGARLVHHQATVDVIALLALVGAVAVDEPLAGALIAVMLATGQLLESRAAARARRELSLLISRAPRTARRVTASGVEEIDVDAVAIGDQLVVGAGELVPVDGRLLADATLDESSLTGEARPVERPGGDEVRSGVVNAGTPVELVATTAAADSTYAGVIRMVKQAQASASPFVRVADRLAVVFVPVTLVLAGASWWLSGDAVRAVAVLVVATPCPLLLATPIAIISGISRAARVGVVVKGGAALEQLAGGEILLFDKTGTLTAGRPQLSRLVAPGNLAGDRLLTLAASVDQLSPHPLASALLVAADRRGLALTMPTNVREEHGRGIEGIVDGHRVRLGKRAWIVGDRDIPWAAQVQHRAELDGAPAVFAAVDGEPAGAFLFADPIRPDAARMVRGLRAAGIRRIALVTGDRADLAEAVGRVVQVDDVVAERDPAGKLATVTEESAGGSTIMVGDGINDAPSLAAADVGVALAATGATASSEAADVVLTVDRISALADAIGIARRARRIALRAAVVGMGLSAVAMAAAAVGLLVPAVGAVTQEIIDVLAIAIALLALRSPHRPGQPLSEQDLASTAQLQRQHEGVLPAVEHIAAVADEFPDQPEDLTAVRALVDELETTLLPHERADDRELIPLIAKRLGSPESVAALHGEHAEIEQQIIRLRRLLTRVDATGCSHTDVVELRRLLYGLYAVLRLHNTQEDESVSALAPVRDLRVDAKRR